MLEFTLHYGKSKKHFHSICSHFVFWIHLFTFNVKMRYLLRQISTFCFFKTQTKIQTNGIKTLGCVFGHPAACFKSSLRLLGLLILFSFKNKRTCLKQAAGSFLVKYAAASFTPEVVNSQYFTISTNFLVWISSLVKLVLCSDLCVTSFLLWRRRGRNMFLKTKLIFTRHT